MRLCKGVALQFILKDCKAQKNNRLRVCVFYGLSGLRQMNKYIMSMKHLPVLKYSIDFLAIFQICHIFVI